MDTTGYIGIDRLAAIPIKYWKMHEFCFFMHDSMAQLLVECQSSGAHNVVADALQNVLSERQEDLDGLDVLDFLKKTDVELYRQHIVGQVVVALTSDMLHFMYECLVCFEKRKFSVGFALLRKPLKEHLLYLSWILADETDFIARFESKNYETLNKVTKERRIEIYQKAIEKLAMPDAFDAGLIWDIIYSKNHSNGFDPVCQRATHLITSMGELLRTEDYSFNFIFEDSSEDHYYEFLYSKFPYLLIFITQIVFEAFNRISAINERTFSQFLIVTMGSYEALFLKSRPRGVISMIKRYLEPLLTCTHCDAPLKITKKNAPLLFLAENIHCVNCGLLAEVPLHWLLSKAKINITRKQTSEQGNASRMNRRQSMAASDLTS